MKNINIFVLLVIALIVSATSALTLYKNNSMNLERKAVLKNQHKYAENIVKSSVGQNIKEFTLIKN